MATDEQGRMKFSKAPLIVLGIALAVLAGTLLAQVLFVSAPHRTPGSAPTDDIAGADPLSSDDGPTTTRPDTGEPFGPGLPPGPRSSIAADRLHDPDWMIRTIAAGFEADFAPLIDGIEADCMAREVVDMLTVDRIWLITDAMADARSESGDLDRTDPRLLTEAEMSEMNARMRTCVSEETADRLNF